MAAAILLPRSAAAHTPGVSQGEFELHADGTVAAHLVFATAEVVDAAAQSDPHAFLAQGADVVADGDRCTLGPAAAEPTETDGLAIDATYACRAGASRVDVTLYFLSALRPGHRQVVRITAGSATAQKVLTGTSRTVGIDVPADMRPAARRRGTALTVLTAAFCAFMVALFIWRFIATRSRSPHPRGSARR
jgi:hypothetical protein